MILERRLQRLARQYVCRAVDEIAQQYGVPAAELVDDVQRFFALPEAEQDAKLAEALAQAQARGDHEAVHLLTHGWATIRSYR
jgi:hypothetical protein